MNSMLGGIVHQMIFYISLSGVSYGYSFLGSLQAFLLQLKFYWDKWNGCRRCYIRFIRKANEQRGAEGRDETKKAFDFMLGHIGEFTECNDLSHCSASIITLKIVNYIQSWNQQILIKQTLKVTLRFPGFSYFMGAIGKLVLMCRNGHWIWSSMDGIYIVLESSTCKFIL
jgi:hypothetical protein